MSDDNKPVIDEAPAAAIPPDAESWTGRGDEDFWTEATEDDAAAAAREGLVVEAAGAGAFWADDALQPDYSHLGPNLPKGVAFPLAADDLALLARLNAFDVGALGDGPVIFGLRGAGIVKDHSDPAGVVLMDQRPDHSAPRCVIGVWERAGGKISVFPASTVPNQQAVAGYKATRKAGNLLPTGLYQYVCGPHVTSHVTPGCFLLRKPNMEKRVVVVRRSRDDLAYQCTDMVERCAPGDNIHPAFFSQPVGFSSFGCQTIVGTFKNGAHRGPWAAFRAAAGLTDADGTPGRRVLYMLLTGAEARLASRLRLDGHAADPAHASALRRLRAGSKSPAVRRLQEKLGLPDPDDEVGPFTAESLHRFQAAQPGARGSDGIFSPAADAALGWDVFGRADA